MSEVNQQVYFKSVFPCFLNNSIYKCLLYTRHILGVIYNLFTYIITTTFKVYGAIIYLEVSNLTSDKPAIGPKSKGLKFLLYFLPVSMSNYLTRT